MTLLMYVCVHIRRVKNGNFQSKKHVTNVLTSACNKKYKSCARKRTFRSTVPTYVNITIRT